MQHPARALLPCLLLTISSLAMAQDADPIQDLPTTVFQTNAAAISPISNPNFATASPIPATQGFPGALRAASASLRQAGAPIPGPIPERSLRLGDQGEDVQWLIDGLTTRGYLAADLNPRTLMQPMIEQSTLTQFPLPEYASNMHLQSQYTADVEAAVRIFQEANGLKEDGVAGGDVYSALTVDHKTMADALDTWAANVASWADQARSQGYSRMIVVNVPSFTLHAIDLTNNEEDLQSRVVVGKPTTQTPLMMTRVVNLKANPDWSPPKSIRGARHQRPGPNNALGLMRFSTDNNMNIYLHDTNARGLFANDVRALSHGCVRVQQWHSLAAWVAGQDDQWVDDVALAGGNTRFLKIDAVPVVITYSLVDMVDGKARKFNDIYHRQERAIGYASLQGLSEAGTVDWLQGR